ncbi:Na+/H+ antiporter NhaA [Paraburkholderia sp. WSM4175]
MGLLRTIFGLSLSAGHPRFICQRSRLDVSRNMTGAGEPYVIVGVTSWGLALKSGVRAMLAEGAIAFAIPSLRSGVITASTLSGVTCYLLLRLKPGHTRTTRSQGID